MPRRRAVRAWRQRPSRKIWPRSGRPCAGCARHEHGVCQLDDDAPQRCPELGHSAGSGWRVAGGLGAGAGGAAGGPGVEDAACDLAAVRDQDLRDLVRRHLAAATLCYNAAKSFARRGSQSESETTAQRPAAPAVVTEYKIRLHYCITRCQDDKTEYRRDPSVIIPETCSQLHVVKKGVTRKHAQKV